MVVPQVTCRRAHRLGEAVFFLESSITVVISRVGDEAVMLEQAFQEKNE
jgi:hypothetical protein